jgi:hypothetical protein
VAEQNTASRDWKLTAIGAATAAAGLYFALVGVDALPPPGRINGPVWLALAVGVVFLASGISVIVRGLSGAGDQSGNLPDDAPVWMKTVYWLDSVIVAAGLAAIGSWVAFGAGARHFSMGGPVFGPVGEAVGRTAFGLGAIIAWLIVLVFARAGAKKIFGKKT